MKKHFVRLIGITLAVALFVPSVTQAVTENQIILKGTSPYIQAKGSKSVVIKDKARIKGNLVVDGTINGTSIISMLTSINALNTVVTALQANALPSNCTNGQVAKYNGTTWECGSDNAGTAYTAGSGIDISGDTISSTVVDTDTTYTAGSGMELLGDEFRVQECGNGQIMRMNGGLWTCAAYQPVDQYDNVLVVAKSGANYGLINAAIDAINTAGDAAIDNRYVIWVAPGTYVEKIVLPDYTDLVGASRDSVFLLGYGVTNTEATVMAGVSSTVSNVTITALGDEDVRAVFVDTGDSLELNNAIVYLSEIEGDNAVAVYNNGTLTVRDSNISAGESGSAAYGVFSDGRLTIERSWLHLRSATAHNNLTALYANSNGYDVTIKDSTVETAGTNNSTGANDCITFFFQGNGTDLLIEDSSFTASSCDNTERAAHLQGGNTSTALIYDSQFFGIGNALTTFQIDAKIAGSMLQGGGEGASAYNTCVYSYDENYTALTDTCEVTP